MEGNYANIVLRVKKNNDYETFDFPIKIREMGKPLWTKHSDNIDVAALIILLPKNSVYSILVDDYLMYNDILNDIELNAGDDLSCLGFPYNTPSDRRYFPILRSGKYASYRGIHSLNENSFLFDFRIYPGNSGGPVFTDLKLTAGSRGGIKFYTSALLGLVSEQIISTDKRNVIEVSKVISAEYIHKTILRLRMPPDNFINDYDSNNIK